MKNSGYAIMIENLLFIFSILYSSVEISRLNIQEKKRISLTIGGLAIVLRLKTLKICNFLSSHLSYFVIRAYHYLYI